MDHEALRFLGVILGWFICGGIFFRVWLLRCETVECEEGWVVAGWSEYDNDPYYSMFWAVVISLVAWIPLTLIISIRTAILLTVKTTQFLFMPSKFRKPKEIAPPLDPMMQIALREVNLIAPSDDQIEEQKTVLPRLWG